MGSEIFGSQSKFVNRSFVFASWAAEDGEINCMQYDLRPGQITYFLKHGWRVGDTEINQIFAVVQWYKKINIPILNLSLHY